jgi:hypothetical protein
MSRTLTIGILALVGLPHQWQGRTARERWSVRYPRLTIQASPRESPVCRLAWR